MSQAASLNPDQFSEGGGLIDDVDVTLVKARFVAFDYNGKSADGDVPCLKVDIQTEDDEIEQYYSMGKLVDWLPSDDGKQLLSVGSATAIRLTSNGGIFLRTLVDAGFPADKLGEDISVLDGLEAHMMQIPEPTRSGIKKTKEQEEKEKKFGPKTILTVTAINKLPWEKAKTKKKPGKAAKTAKPKTTKKTKKEEADTGSGDVESKVAEFILGLLAEEGAAAKKDLPAKIFADFKEDPDKSAMVKLAFDDEFLEAGPWAYEDGTLLPE